MWSTCDSKSSLRWALMRIHFKIVVMISDQIELHSVQLPLSFEILLWIIFFRFVNFFYFLIVLCSIFWGRKNGGSNGPNPYFDGPFPQRGFMDQGSMFCTFSCCPCSHWLLFYSPFSHLQLQSRVQMYIRVLLLMHKPHNQTPSQYDHWFNSRMPHRL